jgi:hypothetical protein
MLGLLWQRSNIFNCGQAKRSNCWPDTHKVVDKGGAKNCQTSMSSASIGSARLDNQAWIWGSNGHMFFPAQCTESFRYRSWGVWARRKRTREFGRVSDSLGRVVLGGEWQSRLGLATDVNGKRPGELQNMGSLEKCFWFKCTWNPRGVVAADQSLR